ncbi:Serine/threonine-protein kinase PknD [Pontiella desulfatans]|uniref:Serine/threonine-protein kinase PknD n=1 Tax=Pontiella desulfatans TaxID=2750659 RepID=A0A6C2U736_PONDE|nr:serine/threonine-protein kinase [Pontiella desulfatans]VGO15659.1 Serine/threonine-protein kinase PknD [Pontiella desulfatans]
MKTEYSIKAAGDMARQLASLYEEGADAGEEEPGIIYSELRSYGDRYINPEVLARGSMKKISRVFDTKTGRHVAMAELRANAPEELYEPFLREARLTALLEHPNIISVNDIGLTEAGLPYFTMDLKRGDSLGKFLKKNRNERRQLLEVFVKLCDAISYAHSQKVLHLDLKPENIQVGRFGDVFICDWGLGKVVGSPEDEEKEFDELLFNPDLLNNMTLVGELKGTPGYMAPEQFEKDGEKTYQTDIYALGCLLHTLLTEVPPLSGSMDEIRESTLAGRIVSPAKAFPNKEIHKGLNAVVMKALELKPANRYASVAALRDDVNNFLAGFSTTAENAGILKELSLFYRRNRAACLVGFFSLVAIFAMIGWFIGAQQQSIVETRAARDLAETRRREADESFAQYRKELTRNMRLMGTLAENLEFQALELSRTFFYMDPVQALELSIQRYQFLQSNDPDADFNSHIAYCYFILQDFAKANEYFEINSDWNGKLYKLSRKYEAVKKGELLGIGQLENLIRDLRVFKGTRKSMMEKMLVCDNEFRKDKSGYDQIVRVVLEGWNSRWTHGQFDYDPQAKTLRLRGDQLKEFAIVSQESSGESPLRFLDIHSLDAQGTGLHDLNQIKMLAIQTLDIRKTSVVDLEPIKHFSSLKTLVVAHGQFADGQLAALPRELTVAVR